MTLPVIGCRVAFGSNPFDPVLVWTELGTANAGAKDVRRIKTKRGRERLLRSTALFQAGTAEVGLRNTSRAYDPTNTAGSHYPNVQPEKVIQIYAVWAGVEHVLWTGFADDWPQSWPGFAEAECGLSATDLFKSLALKRLWGTSYLALLSQHNPTTHLAPPSPTTPWPNAGGTGSPTSKTIAYRCSSACATDPSFNPHTLQVFVPSTTQVGDYLLAFVATTAAAGISVTTPAGWTLIRTDATSGANLVQTAAFGKVAVLADIGTATAFVIAGTSLTDGVGQLLVYSGVDPTTPVNVNGATPSATDSTDVVAPSVTTSMAGCVVVESFAGHAVTGATADHTAWSANVDFDPVTGWVRAAVNYVGPDFVNAHVQTAGFAGACTLDAVAVYSDANGTYLEGHFWSGPRGTPTSIGLQFSPDYLYHEQPITSAVTGTATMPAAPGGVPTVTFGPPPATSRGGVGCKQFAIKAAEQAQAAAGATFAQVAAMAPPGASVAQTIALQPAPA